jgi:hypothetical protein
MQPALVNWNYAHLRITAVSAVVIIPSYNMTRVRKCRVRNLDLERWQIIGGAPFAHARELFALPLV